MDLQPLPHTNSGSNVTHAGHDPDTRKLRVRFSSGRVAEYDDVSTEEHAALREASSHGSHFAKHIKGKKAWRYIP